MAFNAVTNLRIVAVTGKGDLLTERIVLRVVRQCNLMHYLILDSTDNDDGTISNKNRHVYWFPDLLVSPTDYLLLYTKKGTDRIFINKQGYRVHVFYWGLKRTVWNEDGDAVTLLNTARIAFKRV